MLVVETNKHGKEKALWTFYNVLSLNWTRQMYLQDHSDKMLMLFDSVDGGESWGRNDRIQEIL